MYDDEFFADRSGARRSAAAIVPFLVDLLEPRSVVDFGCGTGEWLSTFREAGVQDVVGIDGDHVPRDRLVIDEASFLARDLSEPVHLDRSFDLALCLEVAEHLPAVSAQTLVDSLVRAAPIVLFGAAIPDQRGEGHVNEQWQAWWADLFAARSRCVVDVVRPRFWDDDRIEWWYLQNTLLYVSPEVLEQRPSLRSVRDVAGVMPLSVVHPKGYLSFRRFSPLRSRLRRLVPRRETRKDVKLSG